MVNANSLLNEPLPVVPTVVAKWGLGEVDNADTAPTSAGRPPIGHGASRDAIPTAVTANVTVAVTSTNTRRDTGVKLTAKLCDYCGAEYLTSRPKQARFCTTNCRRKSWLLANPERAAELAEADKARLQAHFVAMGYEWVEQGAK